MTHRVETQAASGSAPPRVGPLIEEIRAFLQAWKGIFMGATAWSAPQVEALTPRAQALAAKAQDAALTGLSQHLLTCVQCLGEAPIDKAKLSRCLRNVSEVAWQVRRDWVMVNDKKTLPGIPATAAARRAPPVPAASKSPPIRPAAAPPRPQPKSVSQPVPTSPIISVPPRPEQPRSAPPRPEQPRPEQPRPAPPRPEQPRSVPRPEQPRVEAGSVDDPPSLEALLTLGGATLEARSPATAGVPPPLAEIEGFTISERPAPLHEPVVAGAPARDVQLGELEPAEPEPEPDETELAWPDPAEPEPEPERAGPELPDTELAGPDAAEAERAEPAELEPAELEWAETEPPPTSGRPGFAGHDRDVMPRELAELVPPFAPPAWTGRPVSAIRWWLVLTIVGALGGIVAVWVAFEGARSPSVAREAPEPTPGVASSGAAPLPNRGWLDGAGFEALLARVHGAGDSRELAALLDTEASLIRQGTPPLCPAGSIGCALDPSGRELWGFRNLGGAPPTEGGQGATWLANLRLPGIGVTDEPRVRAWLQFHTEHAVGREIFQGTMFQCGAYQTLFQQILLRHELPLDLTAVAMVASGCLSDVESSTSARGLWQFSPVAARAYHLRVVPEVIDERLNPIKATEGAVRLLADLRRKVGSWELATASYGLGPFELLARLAQAGDRVDFWQLAGSDPLVLDTATFVSKVQAYALILSNLDRFQFETPLPQTSAETFDLEVPAGTPLGLVARAAATSLTKVRELNPEILGHKVPDDQAGGFVVAVPSASGRRAREKLATLIADADGADQCVPNNFDWGRQRFTRAMAYRCQEGPR